MDGQTLSRYPRASVGRQRAWDAWQLTNKLGMLDGKLESTDKQSEKTSRTRKKMTIALARLGLVVSRALGRPQKTRGKTGLSGPSVANGWLAALLVESPEECVVCPWSWSAFGLPAHQGMPGRSA